jgi:hypothetical protein
VKVFATLDATFDQEPTKELDAGGSLAPPNELDAGIIDPSDGAEPVQGGGAQRAAMNPVPIFFFFFFFFFFL